MNPSDRTVYENHLYDLGVILREMALEAKHAAKSDGATEFDVGFMAGFHRVVSLMQQQAEAFEIPLASIGLEGIEVDRDLV